MRERVAATVLAAALIAGCEPAVDLSIPRREPGQVMLDEAGILDARVERRLRALEVGGRDVVALTFESQQAGRGEASRAGKLLLDRWGADIVLIAVARPGDFARGGQDRERFFGLEADSYDVPRGVREEIVEGLVPPIAGQNDWPAAFSVALDELERRL